MEREVSVSEVLMGLQYVHRVCMKQGDLHAYWRELRSGVTYTLV